MIRGFKVELDPTKAQLRDLANHAGAARFAYNWGLALRKQIYAEERRSLSAIDLYTLLVKRKHDPDDLPWLKEVSKCAPQEALRDLDQAYQNFFRRLREGKRNKKFGFPQFKKRGKHDSCRFFGAYAASERLVHLPRIGKVKSKESLSQVLAALKSGGSVSFVTISRKADKWYASFQVRADDNAYAEARGRHKKPHASRGVAGIDVGLKTFATITTVAKNGALIEELILGPKALDQNLKKLRHLNKELSRRQQGSANWKKTKLKLAKAHQRVTNVRSDHQHKLSRRLAKAKRIVVREDLAVTNMLKNKRQARVIQDAAWSQFDRLLEYKCLEEGSLYLECGRFYPSSKTCSGCGHYHKEFGREDVFNCPSCGMALQRDLNAARNLARLAPELVAAHEAALAKAKRLAASPAATACVRDQLWPKRSPGDGETGLDASISRVRGGKQEEGSVKDRSTSGPARAKALARAAESEV